MLLKDPRNMLRVLAPFTSLKASPCIMLCARGGFEWLTNFTGVKGCTKICRQERYQEKQGALCTDNLSQAMLKLGSLCILHDTIKASTDKLPSTV